MDHMQFPREKMEDAKKEKAVLPLDYDDDDSSEEEEDEELFDNSKVDWRVKGTLLRGKEFSVSENGNCPRCQSNIIVFVILDELFPMGDMPEILYNLLAKGKAVLWSSQDKQSCKKPPTFMCKGFCPPDPLGAGFNINWDTVNLTKLLRDLLKLNIAKAQKKLQETEKEENDGEDEVNEKDIIRVMLAKEKEKQDEVKPVQGPLKEEQSTRESKKSSETVASTSTTAVTTSTSSVTSAAAASYPVSKDGSCPYCRSTDVRYIILVKDSNKDITLPPTLEKLLKIGKAFKMAKGANNPPSFQCCSCTYGFNLDWSSTNLKKIFRLDDKATSSTTSSATSTTSSKTVSTTYQYQNYTATSYPTTAYQTASYGSYSNTQPPPMGYPAPPVSYGYSAPQPLMSGGMAPPMGGMIPLPPMAGMLPPPYGAVPMPYPGAPPQPYPGMPPPPYGPTPPPLTGVPLMGPPPQPFPGAAPNQFVAIPPPVSTFPPPMGGPPMYGMPPGGTNMAGNMNFPVNVRGMASNNLGPGSFPGNFQGPGNFPGNMQPIPRLRVPKGPIRGRNIRKGKWKGAKTNFGSPGNSETHEQWSSEIAEEDNEGEEETNEDLYDPEAETRFEELLNKIDCKNGENDGDHEEEKPPGEETQAEFVVSALTPDEKPTDTAQTTGKNSDDSEKVTPPSEITVEQAQPAKEDLSLAATVNNTSSTKGTALPEPAKVHEPTDVSENVSINDSQVSVTSLDESKESKELKPSPTTAPRKKAARGRKRQVAGGRKKTTNPRNTRAKKAAEDVVGSEEGVGNDLDIDGVIGSPEETKRTKVDDEISQESIDAVETNASQPMQEEVEEEDTTPKRVTRARSLRRKK